MTRQPGTTDRGRGAGGCPCGSGTMVCGFKFRAFGLARSSVARDSDHHTSELESLA